MPSHLSGGRKRQNSLVPETSLPPDHIDRGDPNFISDEEEGIPSPPSDSSPLGGWVKIRESRAERESEEISSIVEDFLSNGDKVACVEAVEGLDSSRPLDALIYRFLRVSIDRGGRERQLVLEIVNELKQCGIVSVDQCERAMDKILLVFEDIRLDVPRAAAIIAWFVSTAVGERWLPGNFFFRLPEGVLKAVVEQPNPADLKDHSVDDADFSGTPPSAHSSELAALRFFKKKSRAVVEEFLAAQGAVQAKDVESALKIVPHSESLKHELAKIFMIKSMDHSPEEREAVSALFVSLSHWLTEEDLGLAFSRLLAVIDDLRLDIPHVEEFTEKFILRAIGDQLLPPAFLDQAIRLKIGGQTGLAVIRKVKREIGQIFGASEIKHLPVAAIWGASKAAEKAESTWKKELNFAVREFFDSHDGAEFLRLVSEWELDTNRCGEIVRKLMVGGMERKDNACFLVLELLVKAESEGFLSKDDIQEGVLQVAKRSSDLKLDIPDLKEMLKAYKVQFRARGILTS